MANGLPEGFVLDQPAAAQLPPGFVPDPPKAGGQQEVLGVGTTEQVFPRIREAFTGATRQTAETETLPEIGAINLDDPSTAGKIALGFLSTLDPEARKNIFKKAIPDAEFRQDDKGNEIVKVDGKEFVMNKPGMSATDARNITTQILSFIPVGKIAALGKSIVTRFALGSAAAGATEAGLETVAEVSGGEQGLSPGKIATAAALGGAAEVVAPVTKGVVGIGEDIATALKSGKPLSQVRQARKAITDLPAEEAVVATQSAQEAQAASEATGVPLFQAQQTTIPSQLEKQSFIAQLPAGTQKASSALKAQNEAAGTAVDDLLISIAPDEAVVQGAEKFRTASQRAVQAAKDIRAEKTSPIYKEAFEEGAEVNLQPVKETISGIIKDFPEGGEVSKVMTKINGLLAAPKEGAQSLRRLHNAKLEIDQIINKFGENALGNTTKKQVLEVKDQLLQQMDEGSQLYKQARETFAAESPGVTALQESLIGKIANVKDADLKTISRRIFDAAETNPKVIKDAKKVIDDVDPDAWNQLLRTELERRLGSVRSVEGLSAENVPAQLFNAMFGNTKQRAVLFNSVDGETAKNLKYLETVLSRARLGRPGGSQTAAREEIKRELRGGTASIRDFFRKPVDGLLSTGEDAAFNSRVKALADAMFDPQFKPRMKEIRAAGSSSPESKTLMDKLLKDVESTLKAVPQVVEGEQVSDATQDIAELL